MLSMDHKDYKDEMSNILQERLILNHTVDNI